MANRSRNDAGSLPARLRYVGTRVQGAHSKWCRAFKRYMRDTAPVAWQIMTGELPEPHTLLRDGSEAAAIEISSDEEATSSSYSDTDDAPSPDPAGSSVQVKTEVTAAAGTILPDSLIAAELQAFEDESGKDRPDDGATAAESKAAEAVEEETGSSRQRDAAGRFTSTPAKETPPERPQPDRETADERALREKREAYDAGAAAALRKEKAARKARRTQRKKKRKEMQSDSSFEKRLIRRAKAVRTLSYDFVPLAAYTKLRRGVREALWSRNNNVIWSKLTAALGDRYSYMLAQLQEQNGVKAWRIVNRTHSESSAASESHYLQQFLQQLQ